MAEMLTRLEAALGDRVAKLKDLAAGYEVCIWCSYTSNFAQGGFDLTPSNLAFLSRAEISCTFSILSWGEVADGEDPVVRNGD